MPLSGQNEKIIRLYLLAQVTEDDRSKIEQRIMIEDDFFHEVRATGDELVDEYLSGGLTQAERAQFEEHFLSTAEGRQQLAFARALRAHISSTRKISETEFAGAGALLSSARRGRFYLRLAASLFVIAGAAFLLWVVLLRESDVEKGTRALRAAYPSVRPVESMISEVDTRYRPWSVKRGQNDPGVDRAALFRAEGLLAGAVNERPGPETHHAFGRYLLATGEFKKAIEEFRLALQSGTVNARLQSDLGAALLEEGKAGLEDDRSGLAHQMLASALGPLDRAVELDGSLLEARFNRALCRQYLGMLDLAEEDWKAYLERDSSSQYANEAREKLEQIQERRTRGTLDVDRLMDSFAAAYQARDQRSAAGILDLSESGGRNLVVEKLSDLFLAQASGDASSPAPKAAGMLRFAASTREQQNEARNSADRFLIDTVRALLASRSRARATLAKERSQFRDAAGELGKGRGGETAFDSLSEDARVLENLGDSATAAYVRYVSATFLIRKNQPRAAIEKLEELSSHCKALGYTRLLAHVLSRHAMALTYLEDSDGALRHAENSLKMFEALSDRRGIVEQCMQLALLYQRIHDSDHALWFLERALGEAVHVPVDRALRLALLDAAADVCASLSLDNAAADYQSESLRGYEVDGKPFVLSRNYAHLGMMLARLGKLQEAKSNLLRSLEIGEQMEDQDQGRDCAAFAALRLGHVCRQSGQYRSALEYYNRRIEHCDEAKLPAESYAGHKGRFLCYRALGMNAEAEDEIKTVLRLFERYRSVIALESTRNAFFDREQDTYDAAIGFAYATLGDQQTAFDYAEGCHARSLLDATGRGARVSEKEYGLALELTPDQQPLKFASLRRALPAGVQLVEYSALEDKLLAWVVSKDADMQSASAAIGSRALEEKVNDYLRESRARTERDVSERQRLARELYDLIIRPVESLLSAEVVCIVPDKMLNRLPFDALISRETGEYVVQRYRLVFAPSATLFIKYCDAGRTKTGPSESLLAIGGPSFGRQMFGLEPLEDARREAEQVGLFYKPSRLVLTGEDAKETVVRQALQRADVAHFATHYVADETWPMKSGLLLTPEPSTISRAKGIDGILRAEEVYAMKLPRTRLVVLSACGTGVERTLGGEGAIGMARPFLKAGVPLVVATLWPVDSNATSRLMARFHELRKRTGLPTIEALRQAKIQMMSESGADVWAAFVAIGGSVDY